jgi:hypothetical protein
MLHIIQLLRIKPKTPNILRSLQRKIKPWSEKLCFKKHSAKRRTRVATWALELQSIDNFVDFEEEVGVSEILTQKQRGTKSGYVFDILLLWTCSVFVFKVIWEYPAPTLHQELAYDKQGPFAITWYCSRWYARQACLYFYELYLHLERAKITLIVYFFSWIQYSLVPIITIMLIGTSYPG